MRQSFVVGVAAFVLFGGACAPGDDRAAQVACGRALDFAYEKDLAEFETRVAIEGTLEGFPGGEPRRYTEKELEAMDNKFTRLANACEVELGLRTPRS